MVQQANLGRRKRNRKNERWWGRGDGGENGDDKCAAHYLLSLSVQLSNDNNKKHTNTWNAFDLVRTTHGVGAVTRIFTIKLHHTVFRKIHKKMQYVFFVCKTPIFMCSMQLKLFENKFVLVTEAKKRANS